MPNLYKQYVVHTEEEKTRVINSNSLVEKRIEQILELQRQEQRRAEGLEDGFAPGIVDENTDVVEEIPSSEQTKEEADRILEEARTKADEILNMASHEAAALREKAKAEGLNQGIQAGKAELEQQKQQLVAELAKQKEEIEAEYNEKKKTMETELVDVILEVFNKVFHIQFDNKKHILMYLIDDAILNIEGDKKFRIKVADSNVLFLENHREEILERVGHSIELEIVADSTMDGNDCIIETDSGVFDCSLGAQLENLIKDIRSLCS